jgi:MYXO-CTERM domain-containing protein
MAYQPAWRGAFLWDDDAHVTRPELRSWEGLYRIWFDLGATQQYYPLLHSAFWIEQRLWGDATLGYHLVNILLHAGAAILAALVLRRLHVPGAYLAAAIFALHPVHVESVAWISEQKNTLSALFYLSALLVYLQFDERRKASSYCCALVLFVLGLLSKTTAATLPAALLVIFWWQRGRLSWKHDVRPLLPFFALGAAAGLLTAWVERTLIGAQGGDFALSFADRCLLAGRVVWFYLEKLLWPLDLAFIYPRWHLDPSEWWQYLFPATVLLVLAGLWALRRRWRGPLAGALFFVGTLFPALGFCNVYPFLFSFVADHFQYLASLGVITLVSAGIALALQRWALWRHPAGYAVCLAILGASAILTWRQSHIYSDPALLYRVTIEKNPECSMAHSNLGAILQGQGNMAEALLHYRKALAAAPHDAPLFNNVGAALAGAGRLDDAIELYRKALEIKPDYGEVYNNWGAALLNRGRIDEAVRAFEKAVALKPDCAEAHANLGFVLTNRGRLEEAIAQLRRALELQPDYAPARANLGEALELQRTEDRIARLQRAANARPGDIRVHNDLGLALARCARWTEALAEYRRTLEIKPDCAEALCNLAWLRASAAEPSLRNGSEAVALARRAGELTGGKNPIVFGALAAAHAEAGQFAEAVAAGREAVRLALQQHNQATATLLRGQLSLYEAGKPFRRTASAPSHGPKP